MVIIAGMYSNYESTVCDCLSVPLNEERLEEYDAVISGRIISDTLILSTSQQPQSPSHRQYLVSVNSVFKADSLFQEYVIKTGIGGGDCGFVFKKNRSYLIYAHRLKRDTLTTSICDPTKLLSQAEKDLRLLKRRKN